MMKVKIIAEAGVNHNGSIETAKKLIDAAARAGADYVKFQTFNAEKLVDKFTRKAKYQEKNTGKGSQYEMLKNLELTNQEYLELCRYCNLKNIKFLSTAFDVDSLTFLVNDIGIDLIKIPSGEITNYFLLTKIALFNLPTVMSTGMSTLAEIERTLNFLIRNGLEKKNLILLQCTTAYPTPMEEVNLRAMLTLAKKFDVSVGYSDHTNGIEVSVASVAMGACLVEKHFTLDNNMEGPDHKASLNPSELVQLVSSIRNVELALGSTEKKITPTEKENQLIARKSLFYISNLKKGDELILDYFEAKRPGTGINPLELESILGKTLLKDISKGDLVNNSDYA
ncbi:MAG: N-acetylneuraminate synthase [Crocinitomicaceae bacterium]|nr:N-acetylneuraminate synthase [Crocinitomicaceae bacterium]MBT5403525.1 N-acetylneuraminate synthase [Crocinitomicaceae bacterium]MBT6513322.1 N-acetylneuraminate synthase [Crocinitomicaceae bacterium]MDG2329986.1 N-acetylneuraminate synthase [Flavobacteriales bacterium]